MTDVEVQPIRVLLVDDDPFVYSAMELIFSTVDDIQIVSAVSDGDQAVAAVQRHFPDVVLLDVRMARLDGIAATKALCALPNPPRVLVMTTFDMDDVVMRAIDAGAAGFMLKTSGSEIITAVRNVHAGAGVLSPQSVPQVFAQIGDTGAERAAARAAIAALTDRERDVVRLVGEGLSNQQIGAALYVGEATVKSHLSSAQRKLGVEGRVRLAVVASRAGLA
ncbi:DNA-binding response regulator [Flexivirga endophytica]|uniref:DNA-binding response regulator n=1 Tax=Flexivirga endophytica TaxID=1849103 RepID=A0A916WSK4_9MICO|nr:response regulator transcription factor [Flexivirga endophytica]GGB28746.1 DNA-binding response regulator [Flexivirga endophytica]GHB62426.1 DNA-binding response regulator [Flexivirga endophytica]